MQQIGCRGLGGVAAGLSGELNLWLANLNLSQLIHGRGRSRCSLVDEHPAQLRTAWTVLNLKIQQIVHYGVIDEVGSVQKRAALSRASFPVGHFFPVINPSLVLCTNTGYSVRSRRTVFALLTSDILLRTSYSVRRVRSSSLGAITLKKNKNNNNKKKQKTKQNKKAKNKNN
jgi:hypothetical protein